MFSWGNFHKGKISGLAVLQGDFSQEEYDLRVIFAGEGVFRRLLFRVELSGPIYHEKFPKYLNFHFQNVCTKFNYVPLT